MRRRLSDELAIELHKQYSADPKATIKSIARTAMVREYTLAQRWRLLGLSNAAHHVAKGRTARNYFSVAKLKRAWEQYPARTVIDLAAEIGCVPYTLRRLWRDMGYNPHKRRHSVIVASVTDRLMAYVDAGMSIREAAPLVGLKLLAAKERVRRAKRRREAAAEASP